MSLLYAHGHQHAARYPLAYLFNEARFVRDRLNATAQTEAVLTQAAIISVFSGRGNYLNEVLEKLDGD